MLLKINKNAKNYYENKQYKIKECIQYKLKTCIKRCKCFSEGRSNEIVRGTIVLVYENTKIEKNTKIEYTYL